MVKRQFVSLALALLIAITVTDESSIENIDIPEVAGAIREENRGLKMKLYRAILIRMESIRAKEWEITERLLSRSPWKAVKSLIFR